MEWLVLEATREHNLYGCNGIGSYAIEVFSGPLLFAFSWFYLIPKTMIETINVVDLAENFNIIKNYVDHISIDTRLAHVYIDTQFNVRQRSVFWLGTEIGNRKFEAKNTQTERNPTPVLHSTMFRTTMVTLSHLSTALSLQNTNSLKLFLPLSLLPKPLRFRPSNSRFFEARRLSPPPAVLDTSRTLTSSDDLDPRYLSCSMPDKRLKVAVLLSGGVDSSVALRLLRAAGHSCTAFYLKIWFQVPQILRS